MDWPPGQHHADEYLKLVAKDGNVGDWFGVSVAMNAGTILIGAPLSHAAEANSGAAYLYQYNRERADELVKLRAEEGATAVEFGSSVALSGTTALIGTTGDRNSGSSSGSADVYQNDGYGSWKRVATLRPSEAAADERFGTAMAADNDIALIGARGKQGTGAAYVFQKDTVDNWREVAKLTAENGTLRDYFGCSLAVAGDRVAVGGAAGQ